MSILPDRTADGGRELGHRPVPSAGPLGHFFDPTAARVCAHADFLKLAKYQTCAAV